MVGFQLSVLRISAFLSQLRPEGMAGSGFEFRGYAAFLQNAGCFSGGFPGLAPSFLHTS